MLKAYSWWNYKIPPMLAFAFYALYRSAVLQPVTTTLWELGLFLISVIGIAGFGHFFLDAFDVEEDRLGGKKNLWSDADPVSRIATTLGLLAASWLPWLVLPNSPTGLALIGLEFVMFVLYAVPPIRLKTRGLPGIVADASYAHVLPILWTLIPFAVIARVGLARGFLSLVSVWAIAVGMRHLMQHQAFEAAEDGAAGTRTFAVRKGAERTLWIVTRGLLPLEFISFVGVLIYMGADVPLLGVTFIVYLAFELFRFRVLWLRRINVLGPLEARDRATITGTLILSQFYELWLPTILLIALAARAPAYIILLLAYLLLFRNGPGQLIRRDLPMIRSWLRARGRSRDSRAGMIGAIT